MKNLAIHFGFIFTLFLCGATATFGQLFYEQRGIMHIDGSPARVTIDSVNYQISDGIISPSGRYLAGYLVNKDIRNFIDAGYEGGLVLRGTPRSSYVLYDRFYEEVVNLLYSIPYYVQSTGFSGSEKWLLVPGRDYDAIMLVNTSTGTTHTISHPGILHFTWFEDDLYDLEYFRESVSIIKFFPWSGEEIYPFHYLHEKLNDSTFMTKMVDPTRLVVRFEDEQDQSDFHLVQDGIKTMDFHFLGISSWDVCGGNLYVNGVLDNGQTKIDSFSEFNMYRVDLDSGNIDILFSHGDLASLFEDPDFIIPSDFLAFDCADDDILFVKRYLIRNEQNLIRWHSKNKTLEMLTDTGYVSGPIGIFKEKVDR